MKENCRNCTYFKKSNGFLLCRHARDMKKYLGETKWLEYKCSEYLQDVFRRKNEKN